MSFLMLLQIPLKYLQLFKNSPTIFSGTYKSFICCVNYMAESWNRLWKLPLRLRGRQGRCEQIPLTDGLVDGTDAPLRDPGGRAVLLPQAEEGGAGHWPPLHALPQREVVLRRGRCQQEQGGHRQRELRQGRGHHQVLSRTEDIQHIPTTDWLHTKEMKAY